MSDPAATLPCTVVVVVGTDHHPFDRLVGWADQWCASQIHGTVRCVVQYGTSMPPARAEGHAYVGRDDLLALLAEARAVVCHAGPSTIIEAVRHDRVPFVVPRAPQLGEHVDGHQQHFAEVMRAKGLIRLVRSRDELVAGLDAELAATAPTPLAVELPEPAVAALALGEQVATLLDRGPSRRLRVLRRIGRR